MLRTFTLKATNAAGSASANTSVTVADAPPVNFTSWFAPYNPGTNESDQYDRNAFLILFRVVSFFWNWRFSENFVPAGGVWPTLRLVFEDGSKSDPLVGTGRYYNFHCTALANGHHIPVAVEGLPATTRVRDVPFLVNATGAPLPDAQQTPWTSTTRLEIEKHCKAARLQVPWPGALPTPKVWPLKARASPAIASVAADWVKQLWVSTVHTHVRDIKMRHWRDAPTGDRGIGDFEKYEYLNAVSQGSLLVGLVPPAFPVIDGPRGVSTLGSVNQIIPRVGGTLGCYFGETSGSPVRFMSADGTVKTIVGWRVKPGMLPINEGVRSNLYAGSTAQVAADRAAADARHEWIGDTSLLPAWHPKKAHEPWGLTAEMNDPVLGLVDDDGHEGCYCDTLNHCIVWWNHWTAHPADHYELPHYPPIGYTAPAAPTGQTQLFLFAGGAPGQSVPTPTATCNEPMGIAVNVPEQARYWTNFGGNSIAYKHMVDDEGEGEELVVQSALHPTDAQLGVAKRMYGSSLPLATLRANFHKDGPAGTAVFVRPQGCDFKSGFRKLVIATRHTYMLAEWDFDALALRTLCALPNIMIGTGSSYTNDVWVWVDRFGVFGAVDDIFVVQWHSGNHRFTKDGGYRGLWGAGNSLRCGPSDLADTANYTFGLGGSRRAGIARLYAAGQDSGAQWIMVDAKQASDMRPADPDQIKRGWVAYNASGLFLKHGPNGQGQLGFPTIFDMGAWTDAQILQYAHDEGMPDSQVVATVPPLTVTITDWLATVRHETQGVDYA